MLNLGIRSGNIDGGMADIAQRMSDEAEEAIESATSRIEPALVLVTSFLVGAILIAVMLPLINIMKALG
jgi:type IV pilus assembly protein PilC